LHARREFTNNTVQVDFQLPERFGLEYVAADGSRQRPVMVHRGAFGAMERMIAYLIEHYGGAFPFWLAPVQIRIIPVGEGHRAAAHELAEKLGDYRVEVDERDETVGKRIRDAELEKLPIVIVFGDKESDDSLAVREHGGEQSTKSLNELRSDLATL
jgi:threonyl-tRNA synthetase